MNESLPSGGGILDHCIIKIERKDNRNRYTRYTEVYSHPHYHIPTA